MITRESVWENVVENTCSLETSKKLWEADIRLMNSICSWVGKEDKFELNYFFPEFILSQAYEGKDIGWQAYPAPNGDDIERFITEKYKEYGVKLRCHCAEGYIMLEYRNRTPEAKKFFYETQWHTNRAEAMAEIALWLCDRM